MRSAAVEFRTDRAERLVVGALLLIVGLGALAFWGVERSLRGPAIVFLLIGALFVVVGIFLIGYRRVVRLDREHGARELETLFGARMAEWHYPLALFEAVGSNVSAADSSYCDVVLFAHDGGALVLRRMLSDAEAETEISRVAECCGLVAESAPRGRVYVIGGLTRRPEGARRA